MGTVGGIDSTPFTFWRSILQSAAAALQGGGATRVEIHRPFVNNDLAA